MNYEKLKGLIRKENLSQNKAATAFKMSSPGFSEMMAKQTMKVDTLEIIAKYFNVPVSYFFDEIDAVSEPYEKYKIIRNDCQECISKEKQIEALTKALDAKDELLEMYRKKENFTETGT